MIGAMFEQLEQPSIFAEPQYRDNVFVTRWPSGHPKRRVQLDVDGSLTHQWHENGQIHFIVRYRNGKPVGLHQWWDKSGKLVREEDFGDGL